jgi:hypothetical protein
MKSLMHEFFYRKINKFASFLKIMSIVIDGFDVLDYNQYMAIAMSNKFSELLKKGTVDFPMGVVHDASSLFDAAVSDIYEKDVDVESVYSDPLIRSQAHRVVLDVLKPLTKSANPDSELEVLANTLREIQPHQTLAIAKKQQYQTLQILFQRMYNKSLEYSSFYGEHSPYSIGTFGNDDE